MGISYPVVDEAKFYHPRGGSIFEGRPRRHLGAWRRDRPLGSAGLVKDTYPTPFREHFRTARLSVKLSSSSLYRP